MKRFYCISLLLLFMTNLQAQKDTLFYIGDPMCSWCYGFAPEVSTIKEALPNDIAFQTVLGGLRPNGTETIGELGDFLRHHWEEIAQRTGQPFSYELLEQKDFIYNTEPACRAVVLARKMDAAIELDFFKAVQAAFYHKNKDIHDINTYLEIAEKFGLNQKEFARLFESTELREATNQDFQLSAEMGIRGFPSMVLKKGENWHLISSGFQEAALILEKIKQID